MDRLYAMRDLGLPDLTSAFAEDTLVVPAALRLKIDQTIVAQRQLHRSGRRTRVRHQMRLAVPALGIGVAAAVVLATGAMGGSHGSGTDSQNVWTAHASPAAHDVLYRLAADSTRVAPLVGRYLSISETDTDSSLPDQGMQHRTSVEDTQNGSSITYQTQMAGSDGVTPTMLRSGSLKNVSPGPYGHPEAWYQALPTDTAGLRSSLLAMAIKERQQADAYARRYVKGGFPAAPGNQDLVFQEATEMLWSPLVQSTLRAALYKVIATTSGVSVNVHAIDPTGRPAIALSRRWTLGHAQYKSTDYENPSTGATLAQTETMDLHNKELLTDGRVVEIPPATMTSIYQPATSSNSIPKNPYTP